MDLTLDAPLAEGESANAQWSGVEQSGYFRFFVNIEALSEPEEKIR